jgi:hypothetical protein
MNRIKYIIIFLIIMISCNSASNKTGIDNDFKRIGKDSIKYHLRILDSAALANLSDTVCVCCSASIEYLELKSGIKANYETTFVGRLFFSKQTLYLWNQWYSNQLKDN